MYTSNTGRIDLERLQILHDRILSCLDAINQVRYSAHTVSPTLPVREGVFGETRFPVANTYGAGFYGNAPYTSQWAQPAYGFAPAQYTRGFMGNAPVNTLENLERTRLGLNGASYSQGFAPVSW